MVELEEKIEDAKLRRQSVERDAITLDNVYKLMINFERVYDKINDEERKSLVSSLIKEIQIYPRPFPLIFPYIKMDRKYKNFCGTKTCTLSAVY